MTHEKEGAGKCFTTSYICEKKSFRFADFYDINSSLHGLFQAASVIVLKEKLGRCVHRKALSQNEPAHQCI